MRKIILPGLVAGLLMLIVGMILSTILNMVFPSLVTEYNNIAIFRSYSDPLMSLFFAYPIALGLILAFVWDKVKGLLQGSNGQVAVRFGFFYWLVASVPGMIVTYSSFQVSILMVLTWTLISFVNGVIAALVFQKMMK